MDLKLRPEKECRYDAVSLGEVMLRLDPGEGRIRTARSFRAWEGRRRVQCNPWAAEMLRDAHRCDHSICRQ